MSNNSYISAFKKHFRLLCIISAIVIPIINNFGISLALSFIRGDIMLTTLTEIISFFSAALDTLNLFLVFAILVNSVVRFGAKNSNSIIILCIARIFIIYTSYLVIGAIVTTNFAATLEKNLIYCLTNSVIDIMLVAGAVILCSFLRSKYLDENKTDITIRKIFDKNNPLISIIMWVTVLISAFLLSGCIINTITDISIYGAEDLNTTETIYLISPYLRWIFKTALGYFVMVFTAKWFDIQWKNLHDTGSTSKAK